MTELDKEFREKYYNLSIKYSVECNQIENEITKLQALRQECQNRYIEELQRLKKDHLSRGGHF